MKRFTLALSLLVLGATASLRAEDKPAAPAAPAAATAATAPAAAYPLTTCIVSDEGLTDMGAPIEYIHKEEGKPDRVVKLCCKGCVRKFKKDPATYLAKLDAAEAAAKAAPAAPAATK